MKVAGRFVLFGSCSCLFKGCIQFVKKPKGLVFAYLLHTSENLEKVPGALGSLTTTLFMSSASSFVSFLLSHTALKRSSTLRIELTPGMGITCAFSLVVQALTHAIAGLYDVTRIVDKTHVPSLRGHLPQCPLPLRIVSRRG